MAQKKTTEKTDDGFKIGDKLKTLRENRKLTLHDLAAKSGVAKTILADIEENEIIPPVATLLTIASALDVGMADFFSDDLTDETISLTRAGERTKVKRRPHHIHEGEISYIYEALETKKPKKHMEPLFVEFLPAETSDMVFTSHRGEEFVFLVDGSLEFRTNDRVEVLKPGDSLYFESHINHSFRGLKNKSAKAIVVVWSKL